MIFAEQWLDAGGCSHVGCADFDSIDGINFADYSVLASDWREVGIPLVINEFMASNSSDSGISDPQGDYDDWVEIYNFGETAIDLNGMYLTDDFSDPTKWQIPQSTIVDANGFVVFWADEDTGDGPLHADFKLSADGEEIGLFLDADNMIDGIVFGDQVSDISYGRYPDANDDLRFFSTPTPLADNNGAYINFIEKVEFSHERGFYESSFNVTMATETDGTQIYYTTDGSEPIQNEAPSPASTEYTGAVTVSSTTYIRASAMKTGWMPPLTTTHTFIFNASNELKSLPVISIVGDEYNSLFEPYGIMGIGDGYNNALQYGIEYEKPISVELINSANNSGFQENCGIRVQGSDYHRQRYLGDQNNDWAGSYNYNKFSFRFYFRSTYDKSRLEYPLFPYSDINRWRCIVIRGGHNDAHNPFIKDEMTRRLHKDMGAIDGTGTVVNLLLNGAHKVYYNPCERVEEQTLQEWYDSNENWDVITQSGVRDGDSVTWNSMLNYVQYTDLSNQSNYEQACTLVDVQSFIDYLILLLYSGNRDWPNNNWTAAAEHSDKGIFKFYVWDTELAYESGYLNSVGFNTFPSWASGGGLGLNGENTPLGYIYRGLRENPEFRQLFADRVHKHFNNGGALINANILVRFNELKDKLLGVIPYMDTYIPNTWVPQRRAIILNAFETENLFGPLDAPIFNVNGGYQHGGYISSSDTITITDPTSSETIYYTLDGNDPRSPSQTIVPITAVLVADNTARKAFVPTGDIGTTWRGGSEPYNDSSWTSGTSGVGYEAGSGYESFIGIDVGSAMYNNHSTCYIRIPFTVDGGELSSYENLTLRVRYDDGFVAYINGTEVKTVNAPTTLSWNSVSSGSHEASSSWDTYDISAHIGELDSGDNILAIHGLNTSDGSSDFLISAELEASNGGGSVEAGISPSAIEYTGGFTIDKSTHLKSRVYKSSTTEWSALNEAVYGLEGVADSLRITEIMYHPQDTNNPNDPNEEYIELKNIGASSINLNLVRFTNGIDFVFGPSVLAAGEYVLVVKDTNAFEAEYGTAKPVAGCYSGSLDNNGERIELEDSIGTTIFNFSYNDDWRSITDGEGYSLTIINPANADVNSWDEKDSWRPSAYVKGSPGWDDSGIVPNPGDIVINEVMAHTDTYPNDWIELHNTTTSPINISGWYLSDSDSNISKYEFGTGTIIAENGYLVLSEDINFGATASDPGKHVAFALSENGEAVYLTSALDSNGILTGYRRSEDFGASDNGVSFGRYYKSSTNNFNFVAMDHDTSGLANAYPKVGPVVINEIMYNPDWPVGGSYENDQYEYIELYNNSSGPVTLYDYALGEPWKFTDGIDYTFPASPNEVTIAAGGSILVVKNPAAFSWRYPSVPSSKVFGPYNGNLSNSGEKVQLGKPGDEYGDIKYYIRADRVDYSDGSHPDGVDLWPTEADGNGDSLHQKTPDTAGANYGNDVINWQAAVPSPGQ
ncbi:MAG: lamin tail domain-containing protein [Phycisphaerae bacterium]